MFDLTFKFEIYSYKSRCYNNQMNRCTKIDKKKPLKYL